MTARTIYTGTQSSLTFDSQVLVFNGSILTFYYYGLDFFDIEGFTFDETDMGDAQITADLYLPADFVPNFSRDWYMEFRGEKFYNKTLQPPALKDTNSLKYKYTLTFESQRADLKRYEFANMVAYGGYPQPLSYDFTLPLTASEFISRYSLNLQYYFGASWSIVEGPEFVDTERKTISFSRVTLWSILTQFYDIFGMRWTVSNISGVMTITIGPSVTTIPHVFKYGFEEGLISIERINPLEDIYTRLSGLGSSRNLPYRYFNTSTAEFIGDPDNNTLTQGIPYAGLMPKSYRDYVKGWNSGSPDPLLSLAYNAGVEDVSNGSNFTPWDFCISTGSELKWGIRKGSLEQNEDIYPTIQGVFDASTGRLDEIIAVETILNDDYEGTSDSSLFESIPSKTMEGMVALGDSGIFEVLSDTITLSSGDNRISFAGIFSVNGIDDYGVITELTPEDLSSVIDISVSLVGVDSILFGSVAEFNGEFLDTPAGDYYLKLSVSINNSSLYRKLAFGSELNTIRIYPTSNYFKQTFDIWIKNIWGSTKSGGESETEYMHRIWDPLVSGSGEMTVMFSDGLLAGEDYEFVIAKGDDYYITHDETKSYGGVSSHWKLSLIKSEAELEAINKYLPYIGFNTSSGDHFFFINIEMPYCPYVYDAEQRVEDYIQAELALVDDEYPTYAIKPSSVFLESSIVDVNDVKAGNKVTTHDDRILGENDKTFFINAVSVNYEKGKILPAWTITISDKPTSSTNTISIIQGELKELSSSMLSTQNINELAASIDSLYLRKDGALARSVSPTTFEKQVVATSGITTGDFVSGLISGSGGGLFTDANGMSVLEVDKIRSRKSIEAIELIINQISIYGGKHMFSSASMTVSDVLAGSGYYRCFFDLKGGSVMNQFAMDDMAYCQRFDPENNSIIKYYWRKVVGLGENYIDISDVEGEYDGNDIPGTGDNIVQLGNRTNIDRQAIFVIDQLGGGRCTQCAGIGADPSPFSLVDKDFITFGYDPSTGRAFQTIYGDTYIGARDGSVSYKWDTSTGKMTIKGGLIVGPDGGSFPLGRPRGAYSPANVYYKGDEVTDSGSTWMYINDVPSDEAEAPAPVEGVYWHLTAAKGDNGTSGMDGVVATIDNSSHSLPATSAGVVISYFGSGAKIKVTEGTTPLLYNNTGEEGTFNVSVSEVKPPAAITPGSFSGTGTDACSIGQCSAMSASASIVVIYYQVTIYRLDGSVMYLSLTQSFTKSLAGTNGADGKDYEFIFTRNNTGSTPATPATSQTDDYVPPGWTDNMQGVTSSLQYEFTSMRSKVSGTWSDYSTPSLWAKYSFDGSPGAAGANSRYCILESPVYAITYNTAGNVPNFDISGLPVEFPGDATDHEFIFTRTTTYTQPATPATSQTNDYVPSGWTDNYVDPASPYVCVWISERFKISDTWSDYSIPALAVILIIATPYNFTGTAYYQFFDNDTDLGPVSLSNSIAYSLLEYTFSNMPRKIEVQVREGSSGGTIVARDQISIIGMKAGQNSVQGIIENSSHTVPASSAGVVSSYTGSGTKIQVYEGATLLTFHTTLAAGRFTVGTPAVSPSGKITAGARSGSGTTICTVADHSAMDSATDLVTITYPITARNADGTDVTFNLVQTITKSKQGTTGDSGTPAPYYEYRYAVNGSTVVYPLITVTQRNPANYSTTKPAVETMQTLWFTVAKVSADGSSLLTNWTAPEKMAANANGSYNPTPVDRETYSGASSYHGGTDYIDIVYSSGMFYYARIDAGNIPIGTAPTDTAYWNPFEAKVPNIATGLLLADLAYIRNLGVRYVKTAESGARIFIDGDTNSIKMYDGYGNLITTLSNAGIRVEYSGYKFLRINESPTSPMLAVRSDDSIPVVISTYGTASAALHITANNATGKAIESYGNHKLVARSDEVIKLEGVVRSLTHLWHYTTADTNYYMGEEDCFVIAFKSTAQNVYLPDDPEVGRTCFVKKWNENSVTVYGNGNNIRYGDAATASSHSIGYNDELHMYYFSGTQWEGQRLSRG